MDEDMLELWRRMPPLPGGLRLYGGTALALYLNHRHSTDFDFATPEPVVDIQLIGKIPWLREGSLVGGPGMIDAEADTSGRTVRATFVECGRLIPTPVRQPNKAENGVMVAHPVDLIAAKIEAGFNRGLPRDYEDLAAAMTTWPQWGRVAVERLAKTRREKDVARMLCAPPVESAAYLSEQTRKDLRTLARGLTGRNRGGR